MLKNNIPTNTVKETSKNPVITSIFTADPSAHVWEDGRIYIYASHDVDPARGCDLMDHYHVFSSDDMVHWTDEGEILSSDDVTWGRPEGGFMWAPDCAYKNGTYYFYYPHPSDSNWNDSWKIGVATSQKPASDFVDQGYISGLGGFALIDPCVFVDEDDRAYMYYGGGGLCKGGELADDMVSMKGEIVDMEGLEDFHEATWVFKRNGLYYLTYADNQHELNCMRYATSENPLGPWTNKGIFLQPTGCSTTHGSVVEYKGQWYLFYHNQAISGQGNLRSVCIDYLNFNEDGTIQTVVQTIEGVNQVDHAAAPDSQLNTYAVLDCQAGGGATVESTETGESVVNNLHIAGAYCQFNHVVGGTAGRGTIHIHYATEEQLAKLNLVVNDIDYSFLNAPSTGAGQDFIGCTSITVCLQPGSDNTIKVSGGHGEIRLLGITVSLFTE
ncbi:MAG: family 43 glycosylhydrolase [Gorillibacterium sp.]|nr:family 43 glycosylhydrolase [Gorillibacterium sp.]